MNKVYLGDCLEVMDELINQDIKVDAIITDPPYGTTACKWDSVIPFDKMWERLNKLIKPNGAIVLFGSEPFSSALRMSNIKNFRYDWIWEKPQGTNPMVAKIQPLKSHENISVFYKKTSRYNPQMTLSTPYSGFKSETKKLGEVYGFVDSKHRDNPEGTRFPKTVVRFKKEKGLHPTQKTVSLIEYLIKTYTNECETVLDFTAGSGTTGIACLNTNRKYIMIEKEEKYYNIILDRIEINKKKNELKSVF
jgi:site-specific DNA-methyltransferase (adenine-specific)